MSPVRKGSDVGPRDLKNHRIFDVVKGRSEADLDAFLSTLKGKDKVRVRLPQL